MTRLRLACVAAGALAATTGAAAAVGVLQVRESKAYRRGYDVGVLAGRWAERQQMSNVVVRYPDRDLEDPPITSAEDLVQSWLAETESEPS